MFPPKTTKGMNLQIENSRIFTIQDKNRAFKRIVGESLLSVG